MAEYVRVKDKGTRHEFSIVASAYEADPDPYELLDKPATQGDGSPLPPKHYVDTKSLSKNNQPGQSADSQKENS